MTIVETIENITDWLQTNVCKGLLLKLPDDDQNTDAYDTKEVEPTAFAMYQPGRDKLPPGVRAPFPSVVVQLLEGTDDATQAHGIIKIQLSFTTWNPGTHAGEEKQSDGVVVADQDVDIGVRLEKSAEERQYRRSAEGWKDVWNFVDRTLAKLEAADYIGGATRIVKRQPITFGQFQQEGQISDLYPYWGAWIIFQIERSIALKATDLKQFL